MVTPNNDDRIFPQIQSIEFSQQFPNLRIHKTDAGIISMDQFSRFCFVTRSDIGNVRIGTKFTPGRKCKIRRIFRPMGIRHDDLCAVIQIPIFFRSTEGQMRFSKSNADEKRLAFRCIFRLRFGCKPLQRSYCHVRRFSVLIDIVLHIGTFYCRTAHTGFRIGITGIFR